MKKVIKGLLLCVMVLTVFTIQKVYAASASISASATSAYVGDTVTVYVNYFAGSWNLTVSGAVSDSIVGYDMDGNVSGSRSYTLTANSPTTYTVRLSGDYTDYDTDVTSSAGGAVTVTFSERPAAPPSNPSQPSQPTQPSTPDNRSGNCNLKSLTAEGFELTKVDDTHYTLGVKYSVDRIKLIAEVEDEKSKVTGDGERELALGENTLSVIVAAENGTSREYIVTVTRRDTIFKLDQLEEAIKDSEDSDVDILIEDDSVVTDDDLRMMKESKKTFHLVKYDDDKKVVYSWTIRGASIKTFKDFDTKVLFTIKDREAFDKAMEFADGILVQVGDNIPEGSLLKINVGDKYKNGNVLSLFPYNTDKKTRGKVIGEYLVTNGFAEFYLKDAKTYFLTRATFEKAKSFNYFIPICVVELFIIIALLLARKDHKKMIPEKKKEEELLPVANSEPTEMTIETPTTPVTVPETEPVTVPETQPEIANIKEDIL